MSKKCVTLLMSLALILGILATPSMKPAKAAVNAQKITVQTLQNDLSKKAKTDSLAKEAYADFQKLSPQKKQKLVNYLQDEKILKELLNQTDSTKNGTKKLYNGDVQIDTVVSQTSASPSVQASLQATSTVSAAATKYRKATITHSQKILGVTVTKLTSWVNYTHNGTKVTGVSSNGASARNLNIAVSIDDKVSKPWKTSTRAYSVTTWKGYAIYKGFGIRLDKEQQVWGDNKNRTGGYLKNI